MYKLLGMTLLALWATAWTPVSLASGASCTSKCAEEEQACLKRTNNPGQCGKKANECTDKCK